jgi:cob(I)alamin adenosyltransferase
VWRDFVKYKFMLYTKRGDNGTTKLFDCPQGTRVSKSAPIFETLGTVDELNSMLGLNKALSQEANLSVFMKDRKVSYVEILNIFQQNLFCIQAELGGSNTRASPEHVSFLEEVIYEIETLLPPITSFIVPGGGKAGASLDVARTIARRAERQVVSLRDKKEKMVNDTSLQFLNRLSSALYALARFANYQEGFTEDKPEYK